ncbi:MAG: chromate transporter [Lautropia sp.]
MTATSARPPDDASLRAPRSLGELFWSFSWLALQGFGGVLAVVQRELVERRRWMSNAQFVEDWAVAQILPGPNVFNLSLMVGGRHFGLPGALTAAAGLLVFPTLVVLALALVFGAVAELQAAQGALRGMGAVAAGLVTATAIKLLPALSTNAMGVPTCAAIIAVVFVAVAILRVPLVWVVPGLGVACCVWAWRCLGVRDRADRPDATASAANADHPSRR